MYTVITVIHVLVSLGLIATVLLQSGKSAGLSGAIDGGAQSLFGKKQGLDEKLSKFTTVLAVTFMLLAIVLTLIGG